MKLDFVKIQRLAAQMPDMIAKGQQIITSVRTLSANLSSTEDTDSKSSGPDTVAECGQEVIATEDNADQKCASPKSDSVELSVAGIGYLSVPGEVVATVGEIVRQANETMRFCESQKTARTEIRANAAVEITKINTMADMVRDYLKRSFDERAGLFDNYFSILDRALESGDNTLVAQTLQSINSLAASGPFKDLADLDKVSDMLGRGGEWDI